MSFSATATAPAPVTNLSHRLPLMKVGLTPRIYLVGPPCCGKTTQRELLMGALELPGESTSDLLKAFGGADEIKRQLSGDLANDQIAISVIKDWIAQQDPDSGYLLDGFPRTRRQSLELPLRSVVIHIETSQSVCKDRNNTRSRDDADRFDHRWQSYIKQTLDALNVFQGSIRNDIILISVEGDLTSPEVYFQIKNGLLEKAGIIIDE